MRASSDGWRPSLLQHDRSVRRAIRNRQCRSSAAAASSPIIVSLASAATAADGRRRPCLRNARADGRTLGEERQAIGVDESFPRSQRRLRDGVPERPVSVARMVVDEAEDQGGDDGHDRGQAERQSEQTAEGRSRPRLRSSGSVRQGRRAAVTSTNPPRPPNDTAGSAIARSLGD